MKITRASNQIGGLLPEAVVTLSSVFSSPLYNTAHPHKIRHPLGSYNLSLQSIINNFQLVLQGLYALPQSVPLHDLSQYQGSSILMECQKNLLRSLDEHQDDCEKILKSFFAPGDNFNGNPCVQKFRDATSDYFSDVRKIVNHLKHSQGRLRGAIVLTNTLMVPTYYVEGVDAEGNPGPDLEIHTHPNEAAISFFRDLRYHLCNLYGISAHLAEAITQIVGSQNMEPATEINGSDQQIASIVNAICGLPGVFLKHEKVADIPFVGVCQANGVIDITLAFPGDPLPDIDLGSRSVVLLDWVGDGISKTFRLPFTPSEPYPKAETS